MRVLFYGRFVSIHFPKHINNRLMGKIYKFDVTNLSLRFWELAPSGPKICNGAKLRLSHR